MIMERVRRAGYRMVGWGNRLLVRFDRRPGLVPSHREDLHANRYLELIERDLAATLGDASAADILDAGCGTGRLAVPLASRGHRVSGIDYHRPSLHEAQERAARAGVDLELIEGDLGDLVRQRPAASISVVLCLEVLYTCVEYRDILREIARILRPGGLLCASFASRFFVLTTLLRQRKLAAAETAATGNEGVLRLARAPTYYNWFTAEEAAALVSGAGLEVIAVEPIARFFGEDYDGMAGVLDVDTFGSADELESLARIERLALPHSADIGKYIYVSARKRAGAPAGSRRA